MSVFHLFHLPSLTLPPRTIKSFTLTLTFIKDISPAEHKLNIWIEFASLFKQDLVRTCVTTLKKYQIETTLLCLFCYLIRTSFSQFKFGKYFKVLKYFEVKMFYFTIFCLTEKQFDTEEVK